jgi:glycosyltransferase involved in cell wall biosynthesis
MSSQRISVAMCTYNGSRFLWEQLQSIASQDCLPYELVVCDDASTDNTIELIKAFSAQAPLRVRVFSNAETLSVTKNFEKAIQLCEGDVIALSDQDDIWTPGKLERLRTALEDHPEAAYVFSDAEVVDEQARSLGFSLLDNLGLLKGPIQRFANSRQLEALLRVNVVMGATMAFRDSLRDIILPISNRWLHDYWIAILGSTFASGICISECLMKYRRHCSQQVGMRYVNTTPWEVVRISLKTTREEKWKKVEAFQELQERVRSAAVGHPCPAENLELLTQKELHLSRRAAIHSTKGITRITALLSEVATGRYQRFSASWRSVGRDVLPSPIVANQQQQGRG